MIAFLLPYSMIGFFVYFAGPLQSRYLTACGYIDIVNVCVMSLSRMYNEHSIGFLVRYEGLELENGILHIQAQRRTAAA